MHIISKKMLRDFWESPRHPQAKKPLLEWYRVVAKSEWARFFDVKSTYNTVDQVGSKTVFDVGGNHWRIIAFIDYESQRVYIRAVMGHKEYAKGTWKTDTFGDDWLPFEKLIQE